MTAMKGVQPAGEVRDLPVGTVTLMFTDIEGSTRLLATLGAAYADTLNEHRVVVRRAIAAGAGHELDTQGDAFFAVFSDADRAVSAAVAVQRELIAAGSPVRVRIGMHTGAPARNGDGYVGMDVHRGARICAAGHGGQVVLSDTTRDRLTRLPDGVRVRPLGAHLLKDLAVPMPLNDLVFADLPSEFPPLRSIDAHPTNLPPDLGDLFGRTGELDGAVEQLRGGARLLTVTGPGGTGKTALASHVAARLRTAFDDGVYVAWLASVQTSGLVAEELLRTLGLRERPAMTAEEAVLDYLRTRKMLLYLDNFEHVIDAAPLVRALLVAASGVQILVTSRAPLRVRGEVEVRLAPLPVASSATAAAEESPAVELFVARARQVRPDFDPDAATRRVVAEICRRLDGLPLAIELAAARSRLLRPAAMLDRLDRPLEVASGGPRHAEQRQQTLRATIAWSYGLLDEPLQRAFTRLGVFAAPFSIEAAEEVCDVSLDDLAELLDHSMLGTVEGGAESGRLGMLETIRVFAGELLAESAESAAVHARHAAWAVEFGAHGGPTLLSADHESHLDRFDAEHEDLRSALDWLLRTGDVDTALALAADLAVFWETRGHWTEGRARLEAVLAASPPSGAPQRDRARALFSVGRLAFFQQDLTRARSAIAEALPIFESVGDRRDLIVCRSHVAMTMPTTAARDAELRVLEMAREAGDPWALGVALNNFADTLKTTEPERARALLAECLELRRRLGERRTLSITLGNVADVHVALGETEAARAAYRESLTFALDVGYDVMVADARLGLARIALDEGDLDYARTMAADAFQRCERLGEPGMLATARELLDRAGGTLS